MLVRRCWLCGGSGDIYVNCDRARHASFNRVDCNACMGYGYFYPKKFYEELAAYGDDTFLKWPDLIPETDAEYALLDYEEITIEARKHRFVLRPEKHRGGKREGKYVLKRLFGHGRMKPISFSA